MTAKAAATWTPRGKSKTRLLRWLMTRASGMLVIPTKSCGTLRYRSGRRNGSHASSLVRLRAPTKEMGTVGLPGLQPVTSGVTGRSDPGLIQTGRADPAPKRAPAVREGTSYVSRGDRHPGRSGQGALVARLAGSVQSRRATLCRRTDLPRIHCRARVQYGRSHPSPDRGDLLRGRGRVPDPCRRPLPAGKAR